MILIYYEGSGLWFDFPDVDSTERVIARKKWIADNLPSILGDNKNQHSLNRYDLALQEWKKNNPPPKFSVVENEIILERKHLFDSFEPVLSYQPKNVFVSALFKLKAKDERRLRYIGEVKVSTLLPCDHPDGDSSGFFFQLDEPCTFTKNDIKFDEQVEPPQKETLDFLKLSMAAERTGYTVEYLVCLACEGKLPLYFRQNGTEAYVTEYGLSYYPDEYGAMITDAQIITRDVLVLTKPYQIPVETIQRYHNDRNTCLYSFINPDCGNFEEIQTHFEKPVPMRKIVKFVSAEDVERLRKSNVAAKITELTQQHPLINHGKASQDKSIVDVQPSQPEGINGECSQADYEPATTDAIQDGTTSTELELTQWLRDTWINEGKPGGTAFFHRLKKYGNQKGSPIVEYYSAGKDAGFKWKTSAGTTGETKKKTILTKVSLFKKTP